MCGSSSTTSNFIARLLNRNSETESGPAVRLRLHGEPAGVALYDAARDRQSEARSASRSIRHLNERLEDSGQIIAWNPGSRVRDGEDNIASASRGRNRNGPAGR